MPAQENALPFFTLDTAAGNSFGATSSNMALPGTPGSDTTVIVSNLGPCHISVILSTSSTATVTPSTGIVILAGHSLALGIGSNTRLAGVSCGGTGTSSTVNIATGS
jgi:hypothetical protein